jgi:ABC-type sugar transport system permease subunit
VKLYSSIRWAVDLLLFLAAVSLARVIEASGEMAASPLFMVPVLVVGVHLVTLAASVPSVIVRALFLYRFTEANTGKISVRTHFFASYASGVFYYVLLWRFEFSGSTLRVLGMLVLTVALASSISPLSMGRRRREDRSS